VNVESKWFFLTREKDIKGPYETHEDAKVGLCVYLSEHGSNSATHAVEEIELKGIEDSNSTLEKSKISTDWLITGDTFSSF
jgi:two-component sensor histidine kinase